MHCKLLESLLPVVTFNRLVRKAIMQVADLGHQDSESLCRLSGDRWSVAGGTGI